jgi:hypothetical protein
MLDFEAILFEFKQQRQQKEGRNKKKSSYNFISRFSPPHVAHGSQLLTLELSLNNKQQQQHSSLNSSSLIGKF